jgi:hypothetical protein
MQETKYCEPWTSFKGALALISPDLAGTLVESTHLPKPLEDFKISQAYHRKKYNYYSQILVNMFHDIWMIYKSQLQSIDGSAGYPLQHNALLSLLMRVPVVVATDLCYQVVYTSELPNGTTLHMHIALLLCDHRFCRQVPPKTLSKPAGEVWIIFVFCFDVIM